MIFTIEITHEEIQRQIDLLTRSGSNNTVSVTMNILIRKAVTERLKEVIADYPIQLPEAVDLAIKDEFEKLTVKKLPGWVNRRVKVMLESVREQFGEPK